MNVPVCYQDSMLFIPSDGCVSSRLFTCQDMRPMKQKKNLVLRDNQFLCYPSTG